MKILLTGGCGFLGHHIVEHLLKNSDAEIVILDRLTYASSGFDRLRDIKAYDDKRVQVLGTDLRHGVSVGTAREIGKVDFILHAAAETHVDNSIVDPLPFLESNVIGTHHLLMLARQLEPKRTFIVSTDEVYGPAPWDFAGFAPGAPIHPTNPYAASKAGAESIALAYANTFKLPITILNGMNFIGERQHFEKLVPLVIKKVLAGETVTIHASADKQKSGTRFYLHCRNFADAFLFLLENHEKQTPDWKIHVVGEKEISNLEMAQLIAEIIGKPLLFEMTDFHSSRPGHDLRYAMVDTYLKHKGWSHPLSIEESLNKTVRWYLDPKNTRWLNWK